MLKLSEHVKCMLTLLGIGFWNLNHLDFAPNDARAAQLAADMWLAVHNFTAT